MSTSATVLGELRFAALTGYVFMPFEGSHEDIEREAARLADVIDEDAARAATHPHEARLERWCSEDRAAPIDLRRSSGRVLRGAAIGVRLRGDQPRLQAIVRDGIL